MALPTASDNKFPKIVLAEGGTLGSAASGERRLGIDADGVLVWKDSGGTTSPLAALNKWNATAAPATTDDETEGYAVGSRWIDVTADKEYVCLDATEDAAVWTETTASGGGGGSLTTVSASITADRAIPGTSTYTDIVDLDAIALTAGTWMGWVTLGIKATANTALNIRIIDGSNVEYVEQEFVFIDVFDIESTFSFHIPPFVLGGSVTLKLQGWSGAAFTVKEFADQGSTPTAVVSHATFLKTA